MRQQVRLRWIRLIATLSIMLVVALSFGEIYPYLITILIGMIAGYVFGHDHGDKFGSEYAFRYLFDDSEIKTIYREHMERRLKDTAEEKGVSFDGLLELIAQFRASGYGKADTPLRESVKSETMRELAQERANGKR